MSVLENYCLFKVLLLWVFQKSTKSQDFALTFLDISVEKPGQKWNINYHQTSKQNLANREFFEVL